MKRSLFLLCCLVSLLLPSVVRATAHRTVESVVAYGEEHGMNLWHITKVLQDRRGFIWISSWQGLTRFDGYSFVTFKSEPGDGSRLPSNRIRDIILSDHDDIYCMVDEQWFLFIQKTGDFYPVSEAVNRMLTWEKQHRKSSRQLKGLKKSSRKITDRQGNIWTVAGDSIVKTIRHKCLAQPWLLPRQAQVRCLMNDRSHGYWVTTKDDRTVALYTPTNSLVGYLSPDGRLLPRPVAFTSPVYCMLQTTAGTYWMGTKPGGIFSLKKTAGSSYAVSHLSLGNEMANSIYDIKQDRNGRIWVATFDGIYCITRGKVEHIQQTKGWRVRFLQMAEGDILMAATTMGLAIGRMPAQKVSDMQMNVHRREADRASSLSNNSTMDILEMPGHQYFVSTESGGVDKIETRNLLDHSLTFAHYGKANGLATESVVGMAAYDKDWLWIVGGNSLMMLNSKTGEVRNYDRGFFHESFRYSDARPMLLPDGRWLFGLQDGAYTVTNRDLVPQNGNRQVCVTAISVEYAPKQYAVSHLSEITLGTDERNLQIDFSALDFSDTDDVRYAFRLQQDDEWALLGKQHTLTLPNMAPGDYQLQLKCSNMGGKWSDRITTLHIHVTPKFIETVWAKVLMVILLLAITLGAVYVYLYIRNIKRKQREAFEAYMALLESKSHAPVSAAPVLTDVPVQVVSNKEDDDMMKRLMQFIEEHISDDTIGIIELADAAATSRSNLNRKMKKIVGLTPAEFLRETRINRAQHLLATTSMGVSEIAYACGFTDPKYFGKTFKAMRGVSPSEYRQSNRVSS